MNLLMFTVNQITCRKFKELLYMTKTNKIEVCVEYYKHKTVTLTCMSHASSSTWSAA